MNFYWVIRASVNRSTCASVACTYFQQWDRMSPIFKEMNKNLAGSSLTFFLDKIKIKMVTFVCFRQVLHIGGGYCGHVVDCKRDQKKKRKKMRNNIKLRFGWWEVVCCSASGGLVIFFFVCEETVALRATNLCAGDASAAYFYFFFQAQTVIQPPAEFQTDGPRLPISTESDSDPQVNDRFDDWVTTSQFFFLLS